MKNISSVILSSLLSILLLMSLSFQVHAIHFDNDDHGVGHSVGDVSCISGHYSNDFQGDSYFENAGANFLPFGSEIPENFIPIKLKAVYLESETIISSRDLCINPPGAPLKMVK